MLLIAMFAGTSKSVSAKEVCTTQYGGGETCTTVDEPSEIKIYKRVYNPKDGAFVENMASSSYKFGLDEIVTFQLKVTNSGEDNLKDVEVKDELPSGVRYKSFSSNDVNTQPSVSGRTVIFNIGDLDVGESKTVIIYAIYDNPTVTPSDNALCLTNWSFATGYDNENNKTEDNDSSDYCYTLPEGKVLAGSIVIARELAELKVLPATGPEAGLALSGGLTLLGVVIKKIFE